MKIVTDDRVYIQKKDIITHFPEELGIKKRNKKSLFKNFFSKKN